MRSWIKKVSFGKKKTVASKNKADAVNKPADSVGDTSPQVDSTRLPNNEQDAERVEKMFSRYQGVELMEEFKNIVLELRGKGEE